MIDGLCPMCGTVGPLEIRGASASPPPTGGDYEWAEVPAEARCPSCAATFEVRVRIGLNTGSISRLVSSPLPQADGWQWYVVAVVERLSAAIVTVQAIGFASDLESAWRLLDAAGGAYDRGYAQRTILALSKGGYALIDGSPLHHAPGVVAYQLPQ